MFQTVSCDISDCDFVACTHKIGQAMKKKYKREMDYVYAVMNEMDRKLDRNIRDLDDVRMIMDTLGKIREQEVDMELKIEPIEVSVVGIILHCAPN